MSVHRYLRTIGLVIFSIGLFNTVFSQCTIIPNAVPNLSLAYSVGVNNATGVAFNPNFSLYYIAQAGNPGFPLETFDAAGTPLYQTNTGFDMRGLWWNDNTQQLESNGYNTGGIWAYDLNASGYALNTGTSIFTGLNQPTSQSVGDYNCVDDEIWYYDNGNIMKRNRATNALIGTFPLVGMPVGTGNMNNNSIFYTDCAGHEIGLVDYVLKRIYFFDKTTYTYSGFSQLPAGTVTNNAFRASWANGMVWLFDTGPDIWYSFEVLTGFNSNCTVVVCNPPALITDDLQDCDPNTVDLNNGINGASGAGNASFYNTSTDANNSVNAISNTVNSTGWYYVRYEDPSDPSCFSMDSIYVTISPVYNINENVSACENSTYTYPDGFSETITTNSSHTSNLLTIAGCDSIIVTNVTMIAASNTTENFDVCSGANYTYPDGATSTNITVNESHVSTLTSALGCDSIITTNLNVIASFNTTENADVCSGNNYTYPDGATSTNITVNETHVSTLVSVQGCDSIVTTNVNVITAVNTTENINACENATVTYPDGFSETITGNTSHVSNLTTVQGCDSIVTTNVTMDPLPIAGTNGSITFCGNDPSVDLFSQLGGTPDAGGTWSPALASGTGVFDPSIDASGVYTYTITNSCGSASATVDATVNPADDASFSYTASTFCSNAANPVANISGTSGGVFTIDNGGSINATTGEVDLAGSGAGTYTITYTTTGPCPDVSTVTITITSPADATITQVGPFCDYDAAVILQGANSGGIWSGPGIVDSLTGEFDPAAANVGTNTITYTIGGSCGDIQTIDIEVYPTPTVSTIGDTSIQLGESIDLNTISYASNYSWSPNIWLDCNTCLSPTATPDDNVSYEITVEENGCLATDVVTIYVLYDPVIFVPNIFSPNGDGNNDILFVRGRGVQSVIFYVYDRWGEKVFESTSLEDGWDGNFRGKPMNAAVFVYYVEATFKDGTSTTKKGDVTLIR